MRIANSKENNFKNLPNFGKSVRVKILDAPLRKPAVAPHHVLYRMTILRGMLELYGIPFPKTCKRVVRFRQKFQGVVAGIIADLNRSRNPQSIYKITR